MFWEPFGRDPLADAPPLQAILRLTLMFVLLGVGILLFNLWDTWSVQRVQNWMSTTGRVVKVEVRSGGLSGRRSSGSLRVVYTYRVWGKTYTGDRFSPTARNAPLSMQNRYSPGQLVRVFFDPRHPGRSVLVRYDPTGEASPIWRSLALMLIVFAPVFAVFAWISIRLFPYRVGRWRF